MIYYNNTELYHHGIKGQKWGLRRFQNEDGSLKAAGKRHLEQIGNKIKKRSSDIGKEAWGIKKPKVPFDEKPNRGRKPFDEKPKLNEDHNKGTNADAAKIGYKNETKAKRGEQAVKSHPGIKKALKLTLGVAAAAGATYAGKNIYDNYRKAKLATFDLLPKGVIPTKSVQSTISSTRNLFSKSSTPHTQSEIAKSVANSLASKRGKAIPHPDIPFIDQSRRRK